MNFSAYSHVNFNAFMLNTELETYKILWMLQIMYFTEQMAAFFCKIYTAVGADTYILVALRKNICIHKFNFIPSEHSQYKKKK